MPEVTATMPEVMATMPEVTAKTPEVMAKMPEVMAKMPMFTANNADSCGKDLHFCHKAGELSTPVRVNTPGRQVYINRRV
jgi:hypothetical protein